MRFTNVAALTVAVFLVAGALSVPARADVSFDFFYSNLSPHGRWVVSGEYGHCWQPSVYAAGWNPYYDGHWVYTDVGWTWVSDYEWGSIPYHYGTWVLDPGIGWVWVPGYTWAPSWVVWRTDADYIGWAPVSPRFSVGVSVGYIAPASFVFVTSHDFVAPRIRSCVVPESRTTVIINRTRIVNNIRVDRNVVVNRGPDVRIVERASGHRLARTPIERVERAAPGPRVTRQELAVDRAKHGLRAAEPIPGREPLPVAKEQRRRPGREERLGEERSVRPNPSPRPERERNDIRRDRAVPENRPPRREAPPPVRDGIQRRAPQRAPVDEGLGRRPLRPSDNEVRRQQRSEATGAARERNRAARQGAEARNNARPRPQPKPQAPKKDNDRDGKKD